jgi:hypothetical protein
VVCPICLEPWQPGDLVYVGYNQIAHAGDCASHVEGPEEQTGQATRGCLGHA